MKQFFYSLKTSALLRKIMFFDFSEILNKYYKYCEGTLSDDEQRRLGFSPIQPLL